MRALYLIINAWLVFSPQVFLTGSLPDHQIITDSQSDPQTPQGGLYAEVSKSPLGDLGVDHTIRIGLLLPDTNSLAARNGAELAVINANRNNTKGLNFELVVKSMEGPWGTGSKQAVTLIFDDDVVAILGSHDGRNAHLVEQVSAKSRVVFLSAWSGDPTLAQAFVPWFFTSVYNDSQISETLIEEIYIRKNFGKIAVVSDNSYDSGSTLKNFLKKTESTGKPVQLNLIINDAAIDLKDIADRLKVADIDCIISFVQPPASLKLIEQLRLNNITLPVYGTLAQLDEDKIPVKDLKMYENVKFVSPVNFKSKSGSYFVDEYKKIFGVRPGAVAACAFDGMNILIEAIRNGGTEREMIEKAIRAIKYEGVTGTIQFDDKGNRIGTMGFVEIQNGIPVQMK
jgi:branched-chain amino acid transport system substrate-binding protein